LVLRLLEADQSVVQLRHPSHALQYLCDGNSLKDLLNMLSQRGTEVRLLGIIEEHLVKGHITRRESLDLDGIQMRNLFVES
jgi:hypothetical protein